MTLFRHSGARGVDGQPAAREVPAPSPAGDGSILAPALVNSSKSSSRTVKGASESGTSPGPKAQSDRAGAHRHSGHPPVDGRGPDSGNRTASRFRFLNLVEVTNPHLMASREIGTLLLLFAGTLCLYLLLIAAVAVVAIVMFHDLVSTLAAHSSQLRRLNPEEFRTTVLGVWGFTGLALAARTFNRWPRRRENAPGSTERDEDEG